MKNSNYKYDVSVIIPTYNRDKLLGYSLDSLILQTLGKNRYEVIVADDGSSDNTREVVKQFEGKINLKYLFQEDKGYRPASARNMGIRAAEGRICVFIDSSVLLHTNCLEEHLRHYSINGSSSAVIGYVYGFDHNEKSEEVLKKLVVLNDPDTSIQRLSKYPVYQDVRDQHYVKYNYKIEDLPAPWYYFWTCHVSVPREELISIGLFDERFDGRWGSEDNDLAYRLYRNGVKISLLRTAEAIHYPHGKDKAERQKEGFVNCTYFHSKFQTNETRLFYENYMNTEFVDINQLINQQLLQQVK